MTLQEINKLIKALENSSCTLGNCQKLAALYICREYLHKNEKVAYNSKNRQKFDDFLAI